MWSNRGQLAMLTIHMLACKIAFTPICNSLHFHRNG